MRIRSLFTVPTGEKVTEKALRKVLISSILSILLCMTCLVSTTWAWFTVSIENQGNEIKISEPKIKVKYADKYYENELTLSADNQTVLIEHGNELDDLEKKCTLYITLTLKEGDVTTTGYTTIDQDDAGYQKEITVPVQGDATLSWTVTWFSPDNAPALIDDTIATPEPTEATTTPTTTPATQTTAASTTETTAATTATEETNEAATETTTATGETSESDKIQE